MSRKGKKVRPDQFAPGIEKGITLGLSKKEALEAHPVQEGQGVVAVAHMRDAEQSGHRRVPLPKFVASEDTDSVWYDEPTGRVQKNATMVFQPDVMAAMRAGEICIRCLEPQDYPFPAICTSPPEMGCSYPLRDRQIMDIAHEFVGNKHLGPAKPITEYLEQQDERREKKKFIKKAIEAGGRTIPKAFLKDATLLDG